MVVKPGKTGWLVPPRDPQNIAHTGWTTDELDAAIDAVHPLAEYGLVSLLIGVNNQYRSREVTEYRTQFSQLLERATGFAQWRRERVMVLSIPDWGITPFAVGDARGAVRIGAEIDAFNFAAREVCRERGIAFVDVTPVSREHGAEVAMLVDDGLHPSAAMYAQWTRLALPIARQLLAAS